MKCCVVVLCVVVYVCCLFGVDVFVVVAVAGIGTVLYCIYM